VIRGEGLKFPGSEKRKKCPGYKGKQGGVILHPEKKRFLLAGSRGNRKKREIERTKNRRKGKKKKRASERGNSTLGCPETSARTKVTVPADKYKEEGKVRLS